MLLSPWRLPGFHVLICSNEPLVAVFPGEEVSAAKGASDGFIQRNKTWPHCVLRDKKPSLDDKFSLPKLSNNKSLVSSRPKTQEVNLMKHEDEMISSATRSTMRYLSSRHRLVSQWQAQFSEIMYQLEREITSLEQLKDVIDNFLQDRQFNSDLMNDHITVTYSLSSGVPRHDPVYTELREEERLTNDTREVLQAHVCVLLSKLSSLKKIHSQLEESKGEATKLTMKCITLEHNMPAGQYTPHHVSYNRRLSHCKDLKMTANSLMLLRVVNLLEK